MQAETLPKEILLKHLIKLKGQASLRNLTFFIEKILNLEFTRKTNLKNLASDKFYRGQMDDSRPGNNKDVTGEDLIIAFENLLLGEAQEEIQRPSWAVI